MGRMHFFDRGMLLVGVQLSRPKLFMTFSGSAFLDFEGWACMRRRIEGLQGTCLVNGVYYHVLVTLSLHIVQNV